MGAQALPPRRPRVGTCPGRATAPLPSLHLPQDEPSRGARPRGGDAGWPCWPGSTLGQHTCPLCVTVGGRGLARQAQLTCEVSLGLRSPPREPGLLHSEAHDPRSTRGGQRGHLEAPGVIPGSKHTLSLGPHGHGGHRGGRSPATTSQNQRGPAWRQAAGQAQPHAERAWPGSDIPLPPRPVFRGHLSRETCPEPPELSPRAAAVRDGLRATIWAASLPQFPLSLPPPSSSPGAKPAWHHSHTTWPWGSHLPNEGHGS